MLSEWLTAVEAIDTPSNSGTDIERATCHGHELGHLQREDEEDEDEDDEMEYHMCKQQKCLCNKVQRGDKAIEKH